MALSKTSVQKAWEILNEINPLANNSFVAEHDENNKYQENMILGFGRKEDGGWENIFMNIRHITVEQRGLFEDLRHKISNTSFIDDMEYGYTRLGWF